MKSNEIRSLIGRAAYDASQKVGDLLTYLYDEKPEINVREYNQIIGMDITIQGNRYNVTIYKSAGFPLELLPGVVVHAIENGIYVFDIVD